MDDLISGLNRGYWLQEICNERDRQDEKWGTPQATTYCEWASILCEEVGELAKELNELNFGRGSVRRMTTAAVQVAAVALAILEQRDTAQRVTELFFSPRWAKNVPDSGTEK